VSVRALWLIDLSRNETSGESAVLTRAPCSLTKGLWSSVEITEELNCLSAHLYTARYMESVRQPAVNSDVFVTFLQWLNKNWTIIQQNQTLLKMRCDNHSYSCNRTDYTPTPNEHSNDNHCKYYVWSNWIIVTFTLTSPEIVLTETPGLRKVDRNRNPHYLLGAIWNRLLCHVALWCQQIDLERRLRMFSMRHSVCYVERRLGSRFSQTLQPADGWWSRRCTRTVLLWVTCARVCFY